jgi:hypothetical protein
MRMIIDFGKLIEEFIFLTPRKGEPEFLLTKPRKKVMKKIKKMKKLSN